MKSVTGQIVHIHYHFSLKCGEKKNNNHSINLPLMVTNKLIWVAEVICLLAKTIE